MIALQASTVSCRIHSQIAGHSRKIEFVLVVDTTPHPLATSGLSPIVCRRIAAGVVIALEASTRGDYALKKIGTHWCPVWTCLSLDWVVQRTVAHTSVFHLGLGLVLSYPVDMARHALSSSSFVMLSELLPSNSILPVTRRSWRH